jgi:cell division protein FtsL
MTQFYTRKPIDNSRLVRSAAPHRVRELARLVILAGLVAGMALLYAWQHFTCIQMRYQLEALKSQRAQAIELNQNLKLEEAGLRAPARISDIARQQLGLTAPAPGQVAPFDGSAEPVFAQMETEPQVQTQARADVRAADASGAR